MVVASGCLLFCRFDCAVIVVVYLVFCATGLRLSFVCLRWFGWLVAIRHVGFVCLNCECLAWCFGCGV